MGDALLTLDDLAAALGGVSTKTARRQLVKAMTADPGLRVLRRGRTLLFTPENVDRVRKALEWRSPSADAATSGTRGARSVSVKKREPFPSSAQDVVRDLMLKEFGPMKRPASGARSQKAQPGGRAPSP